MNLESLLALLGFVVLAGAAASSGALFKPGPWYDTLRKPGWTPPSWVFPVVWTPLYVMIALSGWFAWSAAGLVAVPFLIYALQLLLNAGWSAVFFGLRRPDLAFGELVALWLSIAATIAALRAAQHHGGLAARPLSRLGLDRRCAQPVGLAAQRRPLRARLMEFRVMKRAAALAVLMALAANAHPSRRHARSRTCGRRRERRPGRRGSPRATRSAIRPRC